MGAFVYFTTKFAYNQITYFTNGRCYNMGRIKKLREKVVELTYGVLGSLTDLALFFLISGYESITDPRFLRSLSYTLNKAQKIQDTIDALKMKRALDYIKEKGWVDEKLRVSEAGKQRMKGVFPLFPHYSSWDGKWYLVNFDIPEKFTRKRDILRENLKRLGFARLQNSVWISPYNFLGNVEKIIQEYELEPYVIFSVAPKVGPLEAKKLAGRIWDIKKNQEEYKVFVEKYAGKQHKFPLFEVINDYLRISKQDPQLPREFLPDNWLAEEAFKIYTSYLRFKR